ncbi:hypothetical protein Gotri_006323 [Gossypium trilobum]|uniref:Uncharacterized protein n=1 Tax=Gossypium trilobum TaxID=34281 RepID=A0A7J9EZI0_9ROSI|nr:hypothetical protein [Gossypium trilobum]
MSGPPSPLIENYLREAGFWHMSNIGRGCKLDPKLINMFIERFVLTGFVQSANWGAICYDLLGAVLDNIYGDDWSLSDAELVIKPRTSEVATESR